MARTDLPEDFGYMVNQTEWTQNQAPGPIPLSSAQPEWWAYLSAYQNNPLTIWARFRQEDDKIALWPDNIAEGIVVDFQYQSRYWVTDAQGVEKYQLTAADDIVRFEPVMYSRMLKARILESKGFDATLAIADLNRKLTNWKSRNVSSPTLSLSTNNVQPAYLGPQSVPWSGFGSGGD